MKTLPFLAFAAAPIAFLALPVNFAAAVSVLFGAGLIALLVSDYAYSPRPLVWRHPVRAALPAQRVERLGLAA